MEPQPIDATTADKPTKIGSQGKEEERSHDSFKVKCAIFFGYNGESFLGMQYQRDTANTIENTMHKVLCEGDFILKSNQEQLGRIKWSRAARTDKKVHALCNGISVKLEIAKRFARKEQTREVDFEKLRNYLNEHLPIDIRVFTLQKVPKGFDMRHDALTRVYNYIIPLSIFQPYQKWKEGYIPTHQQEAQIVEKLNILCKNYLGTHNFHNFTKGYKRDDPRCERYMISMKAESVESEVFERYWNLHPQEKKQREPSKERYVRFTLIGQSFIYHQIRKMIGLLVKIFAHDLEGEETIKEAFKPQECKLFLAPGEGLYLNRMTFEAYNKKRERIGESTLELTEEDETRIVRFREYLESQILRHQIVGEVFSSWIVKQMELVYEKEAEQDEESEAEKEDQNDDQNADQKSQVEGQQIEQTHSLNQEEADKKNQKKMSSSAYRKFNREKFRKNRKK